MQLYEIYEHREHGVKAVKRGFSWAAFLVPTVWAAARGLGVTTLALLVTSTLMFDVLKLVSGVVPSAAMMLALFVSAYLVFGLTPGISGNRWFARQLRREGYRQRCLVFAESGSQALRAYRSGHLQRRKVLVPASLSIA